MISKKTALITGAVVVIVASVTALIYLDSTSRPTVTGQDSDQTQTMTFQAITACDVLTEDIVKSTFQQPVNKTNDQTGIPDTTRAVSTCSYVTSATDTEKDTATGQPKSSGVTLLVYNARNKEGADASQNQFDVFVQAAELSSDDKNFRTIDTIGDKAMFSDTLRQLIVLKNGNLYMLSAYKDSLLNSSEEYVMELAEKAQFQ